MLKSDEVELVKSEVLKAGDVVILKDINAAKLAMMTSQPKGIWVKELAVDGVEYDLDGDERLLKLTVPLAVRFDPFSASPADGHWPPSGTLIFASTGPAIFTRESPGQGRGSGLRFDGIIGRQHINKEVMTFARWTLGIERVDGFCSLVEFDVTDIGDDN
jgi:hypothetical protein